jgi:hypothetical protein
VYNAGFNLIHEMGDMLVDKIMPKLLQTMIFLVMITLGFTSLDAAANQDVYSEKNYFYFAIPKYNTKRQGGQTVNIYVKFAYKKGLPTSQYVDYRLMRKDMLQYMEPSSKLPAEIFWEIIATKIGRTLMHRYPIEGVSVQLEILDNPNPDTYEPGDHGPIFTAGAIEPINSPH